MSNFSENGWVRLNGLLVLEALDSLGHDGDVYPLFSGDLLQRNSDGTFTKVCPGLAIVGLTIEENELSKMKEVHFLQRGLSYKILK